MRMNRVGRLLRRLPLVLLPLLLAACATADGGGGPSQERTMDLVALAVGAAGLIAIGALMYVDNQD